MQENLILDLQCFILKWQNDVQLLKTNTYYVKHVMQHPVFGSLFS